MLTIFLFYKSILNYPKIAGFRQAKYAEPVIKHIFTIVGSKVITSQALVQFNRETFRLVFDSILFFNITISTCSTKYETLIESKI